MSDVYTPPEVWTFDPENGGQFAGINRPTAGAREEHELPAGDHPQVAGQNELLGEIRNRNEPRGPDRRRAEEQ